MKQNKKYAVKYETCKNGFYETGVMYLTAKQFNKILNKKEKEK